MRKEKGQSMVEMTLLIPLLFMLLVGIFEVGVVFHNHLVLNQAAKEGARHASLAGGDDQEAIRRVQEAADALINTSFLKGRLNGPITISRPQGIGPGNPVVVTIPYKIVFALPLMDNATLIQVNAPVVYSMVQQ